MSDSSRGVLSGLLAGSTSVVSGISSGITGLVSKPLEGGIKGGALGFFRGVGQGVIGVAVNPLVGVTDGIAAVAQGVSSQLSGHRPQEGGAGLPCRPARELQRVQQAGGAGDEDDPTLLLVVPLHGHESRTGI